MKIVMTTVPFLPSQGGMETAVALLGTEFARIGCEIKVVTATPSKEKDNFPYEVIRQPGNWDLLRLYRWADIYVLQGPSLKFGWPALFGRKPTVIIHQIWMNESSGLPILSRQLRFALLQRCANFAVSSALGRSLPVRWQKIPNPYNDKAFHLIPGEERDLDLVYIGRLVPDKGIGTLLDAMALLKQRDLHPNLTIVGDGVSRPALEQEVEKDGLKHQVTFRGRLGPQEGDQLARLLNRHKIMVVPSLWDEPFGIVALEGIACGCVIIGTAGGGLPEAIGPCGVTFPNGDSHVLANKIEELLRSPQILDPYRKPAEAHLRSHRADVVAKKYLELLEAVPS